MDQLLSMATSIGYRIPVSQARLKLRSESTTDSSRNWSSSTGADPGCILFPLGVSHTSGDSQPEHGSVECTWTHPCCWWSLPQSWYSWYGHADKQHILSKYLYVIGLYWYVPRLNEFIQQHYLWSLTRGVIWVSPQHDLTDLVQNAVSLLKIPLSLFAHLE